MSFGLICACVDVRHDIDPRSARNELAISSRCRKYAVDQQQGGLCPHCRGEGHAVAWPADRDRQQGGTIDEVAFAKAWANYTAAAPDVRGRALGRRELQVLAALAAGKTSKEIAAELRMSTHTVKHHRAAILAKLGADSTPHAVAIAVMQGLILSPRGSGA